MRKIQPIQIITFICLFSLSLGLAVLSAVKLCGIVDLAAYEAMTTVATTVLFLYIYAISIFRTFLFLFPLPVGEIAENSKAEFIYHVYLLFYLILFYPVIRSSFLPVPIMRLMYQALGAQMGENSYSSGLLLDPTFIKMGSICIIGQGSLLVPHVIEGKKLAHNPILLGNDVTIGANSVVLSGVRIDDNAIVSTGAVVTKGTHIKTNEIWGGVPAKLISHR